MTERKRDSRERKRVERWRERMKEGEREGDVLVSLDCNLLLRP